MLGYALFALIGGSGATSVFATVDIGQTMFAYTVYLSALKITDGQKTGARDVLAGLVSNKACLGMAAGIILGVSGAGSAVLGSQIGGIVTSLINFITARQCWQRAAPSYLRQHLLIRSFSWQCC